MLKAISLHRFRPFRPRSIAFRILFIIFLTNGLVLGCYFSLNFVSLQNDQRARNLQQQRLISEQLHATLTIPLYTIDNDQIRQIISSFMGAPEIRGILVRDIDAQQSTIVGLLKNGSTVKDTDQLPAEEPGQFHSCIMRYQGSDLGQLQILFSDAHVRSYLNQILIIKVSALSLLIIFMSLLVYLGLKKHVISPLTSLEEFADRIAENEMTTTPVTMKGCGTEIQHVKEAMNHMLKQLQQRYQELEASQQALQQSHNELQQAQKMEAIGVLAGGIAHDFNNALQTILGMTELLQQKIPEKLLLENDLKNILAATYKARNLVRSILSFSRKTDLETKLRDCEAILIEFKPFLRSAIPSTIDITWEIQKDLGRLQTDDVALQRIFMNLFANSQHAIGDNPGHISVQVRKVFPPPEKRAVSVAGAAPWNIQIDVSDDGCGIPDDIKDQIFIPFFTSKTKDEGTGLGLSMVYRLIKDMGGEISLHSTVGKGTTFTITLPAWPGSAHKISSQDTEIPHGTERILFVDDEPEITDNWCDLLSSLGYKVTGCANSRDALNRFQRDPHAFDALVTDYTMPNINGLELAKSILAIRPELPVILCTGYSARVDRESARQNGIATFFHKPVSLHQLAHELRALLETQTV